MAIPRSKKRKIIIIVIILSSRIQIDLDNEIEGTILETLMSQMAAADTLLFNVENWQQEHEDAWTVVEAIYDGLQPEALNSDLESLSEDFGDKLARL